MTNNEILKEIEKKIEKAQNEYNRLNHSIDESHTHNEWMCISRSQGYCDALIDIYNFLGSTLNLD